MIPLLRKWLVLGFVAALVLPARVRAEESAALYQRALNASGWVITKEVSGAGCLIDRQNRLMLTNYHVVKEEETVNVAFPVYSNGRLVTDRDYYFKNWPKHSTRAKVIYRDPQRDLALIQLEALPRRAVPLKFASELPKVGETVFRVGSPGANNETWKQTVGKVKEVRQTDLLYPTKQHIKAQAIYSDLPGTNGHSGAAVLNSRGELVAVQAAREDARLLSVSIDMNETKGFLKEAREHMLAAK